MTTFYDVDELEKRIKQLEVENKIAGIILKDYRKLHDAASHKSKCQCRYCLAAESWLVRNKQ